MSELVSPRQFVVASPFPADVPDRWWFSPTALVPVVLPTLARIVDRDRKRASKCFAHRAVALVTADKVFFGAERPHGNPPQFGSAVTAAIAAMVSSGYLACVRGVFVLDGYPERSDILEPSELGILSDYLDPSVAGDVAIVGLRTDADLPVKCRMGDFTFRVGWPDVERRTVQQRDPQPMALMWRLMQPFRPESPQDEHIEAILGVLRNVLGNSTSDGQHVPATKAHAAAVVRGCDFIVGVNTRHARTPRLARCAETNAAEIAWTAGWTSWEATLVYSPDYRPAKPVDAFAHAVAAMSQVTLPEARDSGYPTNCGPCIGLLGEHVDSARSDMLLINLNRDGRWKSSWLLDGRDNCYARNEAQVERGSHG